MNYPSQLNFLCSQNLSPKSYFTAAFLLFLCRLGNVCDKRLRKQSIPSGSLGLVTKRNLRWEGKAKCLASSVCLCAAGSSVWPSLPILCLWENNLQPPMPRLDSAFPKHILVEAFITGLQLHGYPATPPPSPSTSKASSNSHLLHPQCPVPVTVLTLRLSDTQKATSPGGKRDRELASRATFILTLSLHSLS